MTMPKPILYVNLSTILDPLKAPQVLNFLKTGDRVVLAVGDTSKEFDVTLEADNDLGLTGHVVGNKTFLVNIQFTDGSSREERIGIVDDVTKTMATNGNDKLFAISHGSVIRALAGDDLIVGHTRADSLYGGNGNDRIHGGGGGDTLIGENGNDTIYGDAGNDLITGGDGNDVLRGGADHDRLYGHGGNDNLAGDAGSDILEGGAGDDALNGGSGNDVLDGGAGNDNMSGGSGRDILFGGSGKDTIRGGTDDDNLYGGAGNDTLNGNAGDDALYGGGGSDTFVFNGQGGHDRVYLGEDISRDYAMSVATPERLVITSDHVGVIDVYANASGVDIWYDGKKLSDAFIAKDIAADGKLDIGKSDIYFITSPDNEGNDGRFTPDQDNEGNDARFHPGSGQDYGLFAA